VSLALVFCLNLFKPNRRRRKIKQGFDADESHFF
jgi:hypothetical protein